MDDLQILREAWEAPTAPSVEARFRARTALTSRTATRRPRRRTGIRVGMAGILAAAAATAVTVALPARHGDEAPAGRAMNVAMVLDRAAGTAEGRSFTAPRPGQWLYVEERTTTSARPGGISVGPPYVTGTYRTWLRADGRRQAAASGHGSIKYSDTLPGLWPPQDYPSLAALPTEPTALHRWVYRSTGTNDTDAERASSAFLTLSALLRRSVLPPKVEAGIFRTLKTLPGVTLLPETVDVAGRPAVALGMTTEGWVHTELLLDRRTYAYMGERGITIKDRTVPADDRGTGKTIVVKKGTIQLLTVRLAQGVVDRPGQRP